MPKALLQSLQKAVSPAGVGSLVGAGRIVAVLPRNRYLVNFNGRELIASSATDEPIRVGKLVHVGQQQLAKNLLASQKLIVLGSA